MKITPKRTVLAALLLVLLSFNYAACDGLDIGGMLGLEGEGFSTLPIGAYPVEDKINNLAQVRITQSGFQFVERNLVPIIEAALGGSMTFELPEGGAVGCTYCGGGCEIELNIANVAINPIHPDKLEVKIWLRSDTQIVIPLACLGGLLSCDVKVDTYNRPLEITTLILMQIDGPTRQLNLVVNEPDFSLDNINITMTGLCSIAGGLVSLVKGILDPILKPMISDIVTELVEGFKCVKCDVNPCNDPYFQGVSCDANQICRKPNNDCQLLPLGIEAEVDVGALAGGMLPSLQSVMWLSLAAGGRAQAVDGGMEIAMFGGTMVPPDQPDPCTEPIPYPISGNIPPIPMSNVNPNTTPPIPYHIGIGLREELMDQAGFTLQNSGLLCMTLDSSIPSVGSYLALSNFALLLPSINKLTGGEDVASAIMLTPGERPPDFRILDGEDAFPNNPGVDVGLAIDIKDLNLNVYGLVDERFVRMFTLQVDVGVTLGLDLMDFAIQIVFGLDNVVLSNFRVPYSILAKDPAEMASGLESLIGGLLGQIPLDPFAPIELPGIDLNSDEVLDMFIQLQEAAAEMPKSSGSPTEYQALVIYAELISANRGQRPAPPYIADTSASITDSFLPTRQEYVDHGAKPWVKLALGGVDADGGTSHLEYQFAIDNSGWTPWEKETSPTIDAKWLAWQGVHNIKVRARDSRYPGSYDREPATVRFVTDFTAPTLKLARTDGIVRFEGHDLVTAPEDLLYRFRVNGGEWSAKSDDNLLHLAMIKTWPAKVEVEVTDTAGYSATTEMTYAQPTVQKVVAKKRAAGATGEAQPFGGCGSTSASGWWLLALLPLLAIRRRSLRAMLPMLLAVALVAGIGYGCSSSGAACTKNTDCGAGEMCQNGSCITVDDDGVTHCTTDTDCGIAECCNNSICQPGYRDENDECQPPDDGDTDGDVEDGDTDGDTDGDVVISCRDEPCPSCYYCNRNQECVPQLCDPSCTDKIAEDMVPCTEQKDDACAVCVVNEGTANVCEIPRCTSNDDPEIIAQECGCRGPCAPEETLGCRVTTGECVCFPPCGGSCPDSTICCNNPDVPGEFSQCLSCPSWCEGVTCEPGFAPGGCNPEEDYDCEVYVGDQLWTACSSWDDEICEFGGPGRAGDPSCDCKEKPPLPMGMFGRYNDIAMLGNDLWISAYNETYGDLMVVYASVNEVFENRILIDESRWQFIDGVPDEEPKGGPSGPRGGILGDGDDVGKFSAIAITSEGLPVIAYQDVENSALAYMYATAEIPTEGRRKDGVETPQYEWTKIIVDDTGDTGYYVDMYLDDQDRPVIAYMTAKDSDGNVANSQLKLAMASSAAPAGPEDFVLKVVDSAQVGPQYCDDPAGCTFLKDVTFGVGVNPSLNVVPGGELWIFYYHHTTYKENGAEEPVLDNVKVGDLKVAKLVGLPEPGTLASATFNKSVFLGNASTLVDGDVGLYHSFDVIETNGWYVVAFSNQVTHELQFVYDFGDGLTLVTADDGARRDRRGNKYKAWVGADCSAAIDQSGYIRILYQNQSEGMLMYYAEQCYGICTDRTVETMTEKNLEINAGTGNAEEYGYSAGYHNSQVLFGGMTTILNSYVADMSNGELSFQLEVHTAPPGLR